MGLSTVVWALAARGGRWMGGQGLGSGLQLLAYSEHLRERAFAALRQQSGSHEKKILPSAQREASQVYNQNLYTTIVVVLTTATFCG